MTFPRRGPRSHEPDAELPEGVDPDLPGVSPDLARALADELIERGVFLPVMMTVEDAARASHIEERVLRRWIAQGRIPATKVGKRWIVPRDRLLRYVEAMAERNVARAASWPGGTPRDLGWNLV
jgi:excisionase family DNA binding protein